VLREIVNGQAGSREGKILRTPVASMEAALAQEFMKGEAAGMRLILTIPENFLAAGQAKDEETEDYNKKGDDDVVS
jgi:hypothetical protein